MMGAPRAGESSLPKDMRNGLDALLATAAGTLAGILIDSGFTVREAVLRPVYWLLGPLFDLFAWFPHAQLVVADVIDRLPVVLIVGLAIGLLLRNLRFPRLLLVATMVWPICVVIRKLAVILFSPDNPDPIATSSLVPGIAVYAMQYALLILVIRAADRAVRKHGRP